MSIKINPCYSPYLSVVYLSNGKPHFDTLSIESDCELENLTLRVTTTPEFVEECSFDIDKLTPEVPLNIAAPAKINYDLVALKALTEAEPGRIHFSLYQGTELLCRESSELTWLPGNAWVLGKGARFPELLAALVQPNDPAVDKVLHHAGELLANQGLSPDWNGYRSEPNAIINKLHAIWLTLSNYGINYALPARGEIDIEEGVHQKVRTPSQIMQGGCATCLDTTMLMAAVIAQAGFNPLIIHIPGHAFVGVLLKDECLKSPIVESSATLRNLVELGEMLVLETTMLTRSENGLRCSFDSARLRGEENLSTTEHARAYDVARIWAAGVRPIGTERPENATSIVDEHTCTGEGATFLPEQTAAALEDEQSLVTTRKRTRMENWQLKLLDLSMRNNLLNCRIDKSQVHIVLQDAARLEDDLSNGKVFKLAEVPVTFALDEALKKEDKTEAQAIIQSHAAEMYAKNELLAVGPQGILPHDELQKRLYKLYLAARKNMEESGYNTLYIACGFLRWVRREKNQTLYAPLLLIPVKISRKSVKSSFTLRTSDEETRINLTLLELLKTEYALNIPELEGELPSDKSGIDVAQIFDITRRAIKDIEGWEVIETCSLGIFSFAKYLMWKDLCDRQHELMENPIVRHLADENRQTFPTQVGFPEVSELDTAVDAEQVYTPLSSDSSQLSAVLAAGRGKNFVLIGPPGTGKSQTISNMIAHCLGHGKTVLFVAEKAAALSVVYKRLKNIGLGDSCLELHSNKAVKKEVLAQFKAALDNTEAKLSGANWAKTVCDMLKLRSGLNVVPEELHRVYPDATSLYDDISLLAEAPAVPLLPPPAQDVLNISANEKAELLEYIHELSTTFSPVAELYPGSAQYLQNTRYSLQWDDDFTELLPRVARMAERYDTELNTLMELVGLNKADYADKRRSVAKLLLLAARTYGQNNAPLLPDTAQDTLNRLQEALGAANNYRQCKNALSLRYPDGTEDNPDIKILYMQWREGVISNIISRFFINRKISKALRLIAFSCDKPDIGRDLQNLVDMQRYKSTPALAESTLPQYCKGIETSQADYEAACHMAATLSDIADITPLCRLYLSVEGNPFAPGSPAVAQATKLQLCVEEWQALAGELAEKLGAPYSGPETEREGAAATMANDLMKNRDSWRQITIFNETAAKANTELTRALVSKLCSAELKPTELEAAVLTNYARYRLRTAVDASRTLTHFDGATHEKRIRDFCAKDALVHTEASRHLQSLLRTRACNHKEFTKELAELNHELNKQRAHKAIRKLLTLTPNVSRLLKPCMLMSPLSVAQYLTPESEPFDLVIFDEASQIPVWDAIGAIGRGKSAVIVGDPRQMPPTSFFSRSRSDESEEDEEIEQDLESILDECLACGIPHMNLSWHYRSKSESLIAYSNHHYYENKLVTFPAPVEHDTALQYHYVDGIYAKGASKRYNKKEAQALVEHVLGVLRSPGFDYNELTSIGIVTFNTQQQALILDMFEKARAEDESLEPYFNDDNPEGIFVKNLENVQGDERGVIYFSTTYGPDEKGAISMNFGPLNLTGGERRLNVAITRARTGMHVFSSLKPEDIDLNRTRSRGAADLRGFLECARMGAAAYFNLHRGNGAGPADSGLQRAICRALQAQGWHCLSNLGVSGYRIDIAIAHPEQPGSMLAGIVLDSPSYAAAATARDRDVLRESVLHGLGWNICHIWALDWWRNPQSYAAKIDKQLRHLLKKA